MADHEITPLCEHRFARIEERLDQGDVQFKDQEKSIHSHDVQMMELRTQIQHLVKSMDGQIKAIWGMVVTLVTMGIGFVIWFI